MKKLFLSLLAVAVLLVPSHRLVAADNPAASADFTALLTQINDDLKAGKRTEAEQADHLKQFDALLVKYKGDTSDDVAKILYMKAMLYVQVFKNDDKGAELIKQVQHDFPDSTYGKQADKILAGIAQAKASEKVQSSLVENAPFPDFDVKDLDGKPLSIASLKGKVVMIDFWATWCGPCRGEVPNVVKAYQKYHDKGFEIIGISLDQADAKDKLTAYMKENNMTWHQYYDGGYWTNALAVKYGIQAIPAGFLLGRDGKILAKGDTIRGEGLEPAIVKALGAN
jgi:thiol-disulfide isomerase/thioredoxin